MRLHAPLNDLFRTGSHVRILRALNDLPAGHATSARDLARRAGISHPTASAVLASLLDQGLVKVRRTPRADLFEFNRSHALVEHITPLLDWEQSADRDLTTFLRTRLSRTKHGVRDAFIFGSAARGDMQPSSDIDLAVIAEKARGEDVRGVLDQIAPLVRARFGNQLNVIVVEGEPDSPRGRRRTSGSLWERISAEGVSIFEPEKRQAHA
ncbi:MAG: MarR family transcriptional regulator [Actinomycetota bacterium]